MPTAADVILRIAEKYHGTDASSQRVAAPSSLGLGRRMTATASSTDTAPVPILPKNLRRLRLFDIDPQELARQLTLLEWRIYNRIDATEFLNKAWSDKIGNAAPNIKAVIECTNQVRFILAMNNFYCLQVTSWVAESILNELDVKRRCNMFKYFIYVAEVC
jgi:son of sevenless-like protein